MPCPTRRPSYRSAFTDLGDASDRCAPQLAPAIVCSGSGCSEWSCRRPSRYRKGQEKQHDRRTRTEEGALPRCECELEYEVRRSGTPGVGRTRLQRLELLRPDADPDSHRHGREPKGVLQGQAHPVDPSAGQARHPQITQNTSRGLVTRQPGGAPRTDAGSALHADPLSTHSTLSGLGRDAPMRITRPIRVSLSSKVPPNVVSTLGHLTVPERVDSPQRPCVPVVTAIRIPSANAALTFADGDVWVASGGDVLEIGPAELSQRPPGATGSRRQPAPPTPDRASRTAPG